MSLQSKTKRVRRNKPKLGITGDTETYKVLKEYIDKKGEKKIEPRVYPYLIGGCCDGKFDYSTGDHSKFFDFLKEKSKTHKLILIAHNANYDLTVIIPEYLTKYQIEKIDYKVSSNETFISCEIKCKDFSFICGDTSVGNVHIRSLSNWLKLIGKPDKLEGIEYDKGGPLEITDTKIKFKDKEGNPLEVDLAHELEYLKRDVEGTMEVFEYQSKQRDELYKMCGLRPKQITSTTAPAAMKKVINDKFGAKHGGMEYFDDVFRPKILPTERAEYERRIQSSCGGFTSCNKDYLKYYSIDELIQSYDINSEYPFVMYHGIPAGEMLEKQPEKPHVIGYEIGVSKCEGKKDYSYISTPPLPSRGCKLDHTIYLLKDYYDVVFPYMDSDIEIVDTGYQEINYDLTPFIKDLYTKKLQAEKIEDPQIREFVRNNIKLGLNSIYGKLCEKTYEEETYYDLDLKDFLSDPIIPEFFRSPMGGVYVAQRARTLLIKNILKEINKKNIFLYADTDSIKLVEKTPVSFFVDNNALGGGKREGCGENKNRGYTDFLCTGKIKKGFMGNKNINKPPKMAFSGITTRVKEEIRHNSDGEILEELFNPLKNIKVINGKISDTRNSLGQTVIESNDICLNGNDDTATHELRLNKETKKYQLTKITK